MKIRLNRVTSVQFLQGGGWSYTTHFSKKHLLHGALRSKIRHNFEECQDSNLRRLSEMLEHYQFATPKFPKVISVLYLVVPFLLSVVDGSAINLLCQEELVTADSGFDVLKFESYNGVGRLPNCLPLEVANCLRKEAVSFVRSSGDRRRGHEADVDDLLCFERKLLLSKDLNLRTQIHLQQDCVQLELKSNNSIYGASLVVGFRPKNWPHNKERLVTCQVPILLHNIE